MDLVCVVGDAWEVLANISGIRGYHNIHVEQANHEIPRWLARPSSL
jgi:hypothetical protein